MATNGNIFSMTPYSTWAMPKLDWNLVYRAGETQQLRGEKAEQKISDFSNIYDNLNLHEKYNEPYQNWKKQTDEEIDNLINQYGGKLGTQGFNRDLSKLVSQKKTDPWIRNAIQTSNEAKLYEENILRNPDIKPYNDPNHETYLNWLEDKTPEFKYKGFYKDAPPDTWFAAKAKDMPSHKWTEFGDIGKYGRLTTQHDTKDEADIRARFEETKTQFMKTPEGQQMQRMIDAGVYGNMTFDEVFGTYATAAAKMAEYDNYAAAESKNIEKEAEFEREKFKTEKEFKRQELADARNYRNRSLDIAQQNANATTYNAETSRYNALNGGKSGTNNAFNHQYNDDLFTGFSEKIMSADPKVQKELENFAAGKGTLTIPINRSASGNKVESTTLESLKNDTSKGELINGKSILGSALAATEESRKSSKDKPLGLHSTGEVILEKDAQGNIKSYVMLESASFTKKDILGEKGMLGYKGNELLDDLESEGIELELKDFEEQSDGTYKLKMKVENPGIADYFNILETASNVNNYSQKIPNTGKSVLAPPSINTTPPTTTPTQTTAPTTNSTKQNTTQTSTTVNSTQEIKPSWSNKPYAVKGATMDANGYEEYERSGVYVISNPSNGFGMIEIGGHSIYNTGRLEIKTKKGQNIIIKPSEYFATTGLVNVFDEYGKNKKSYEVFTETGLQSFTKQVVDNLTTQGRVLEKSDPIKPKEEPKEPEKTTASNVGIEIGDNNSFKLNGIEIPPNSKMDLGNGAVVVNKDGKISVIKGKNITPFPLDSLKANPSYQEALLKIIQ